MRSDGNKFWGIERQVEPSHGLGLDVVRRNIVLIKFGSITRAPWSGTYCQEIVSPPAGRVTEIAPPPRLQRPKARSNKAETAAKHQQRSVAAERLVQTNSSML
jgi:hypothetical protein